MTLQHTRRVLWAFGLESAIFVAISLFLDRIPSWLLTVSAIVAVILPIIFYLTIIVDPAVYRSWLELGGEIYTFILTGLGFIRECFTLKTIRKLIYLVRTMKICPATFDDWVALSLFPFKTYVFMAVPFLWSCHFFYSVFSGDHHRMRGSDAFFFILNGYLLSFLVLLIGALFQALFSNRGRATQTLLVFFLGLIMILMAGSGLLTRM
jgi:hypothetical protein